MRKTALLLSLALTFAAALPAQDSVLPEHYREPFAKSFPIREQQHLQIKAYAEKLPPAQNKPALPPFAPDYSSVEAYTRSVAPLRERLHASFGVPPGAREGRLTRFERVGEDRHCTVYRVWIEVIDGVEAYGLYLLPKKLAGKAPLLIAQHGGGGNPEAICDLDTREAYRGLVPEAVKRGYIVWAPALAMRCGYCNDPEIPGADREVLDRLLRRGGISIIGLELHKIIASTQALVKARPEIDPERIGMTGLSWGGFYTMYVTALSPFIKAAAPAGYIKDYEDLAARAKAGKLGIPDRDIVNGVSHARAIALICPRPILVQMGEKDTVVPIAGARIEAGRAAAPYRALGVGDRYRFHVHADGHVFDPPAILEFFARNL
ncbi:MAG TPA: dienelactone hydrolase family protein [Opitutaceae bacterium]